MTKIVNCITVGNNMPPACQTEQPAVQKITHFSFSMVFFALLNPDLLHSTDQLNPEALFSLSGDQVPGTCIPVK
jgi:hypothetical protein